MPSPLSVTFIYNKSNHYGLTDDINVIERLLKKLQDKIGQTISKPKLIDMREPPVPSDIMIHLEIPIFSAVPWAFTNILLVNPEQWSYAYDAYVHAFDLLLFRDQASADQFKSDFEAKGIPTHGIRVIPWCASWQVKDIDKRHVSTTKDNGFVSFLAGSKNKYEYMAKLLPHWKESDPRLTIYTSRQDFSDGLKNVCSLSNVEIKYQDLDSDTRSRLMTSYRGHVICSQGEGFGYAAANAEVAGVFSIMNSLPTFQYTYHDDEHVSWLSNTYTPDQKIRHSHAAPSEMIREELDAAFEKFNGMDVKHVYESRQKVSMNRFQRTYDEFYPLLSEVQQLILQRKPKGIVHIPPILDVSDCPPISIITPTYNRKHLIDIAFHNLLASDYPKDKMEWIVIEDNEKTPHMSSEKIIDFQIQVPQIRMKYIPIEGRMTIGEKRNIAIEHASHDIILFMDDDDHYPSTSFRRRVAWLLKGMKQGQAGKATIACCTTLALYDLKFGTSAVNVPPFDIAFSQRISEATLTFYKSAWLECPFPKLSISEGEEWIHGREDQVIEIPPQQIIVAFSHGNNQSSRRIPPSDQPPSCFWGFPKEYLIFIHGLIGIQVEEDTNKSTKSKKSLKK
jgi:hypothetical protein